MGSDTKALRNRIKSVRSTLHLTKAMGLVASSKIRRAGEAMQKSRQYADHLDGILSVLSASPECQKSPYMRHEGDRTRLIVVAGDRGLAGGYNANVFRLCRSYPDAQIIAVGKRACDRFSGSYISAEHFGGKEAYALAKQLCDDFVAGEFDRLGVLYTRYVSMMSQEATIRWILPFEKNEAVKPVSAVFEPDEMTVMTTAVPEYTAGVIVAAVRESFLSEVAARRMAMDSAGKNATQMIDDLQLQYNRARQSSITQEITEIVAGSDVR